jgi:glutamyl-tRNA reductase
LSTKGAELEKAVATIKEALEEALKGLEAQAEAATIKNLEKTIKMIKDNMLEEIEKSDKESKEISNIASRLDNTTLVEESAEDHVQRELSRIGSQK